MKRILIIDEYEPIRNYLFNKLSSFNFDVITASNGLQGMFELRKSDPALVIMDYYLSRKSSKELLKEKNADPNIAPIPIIILSSRLKEQNTTLLKKFHIYKILSKPLKIDLLFNTISALFGISLKIDQTPCILEAHFNEEILFIEIARGLNKEKIELLQYKIHELTELYKIKKPRILIIMSDISEMTVSQEKLVFLFKIIIKQTATPREAIKLLTTSEIIIELMQADENFTGIEITGDLEKAMNNLMGIKITDFLEEGKNIIKKDFITSTTEIHSPLESIQLKFDRENLSPEFNNLENEITIAVIDDDVIIHNLIKTVFTGFGWNIKCYPNGILFIKDLATTGFDIVFLDLLMPEMNGFQVLEYLRQRIIHLPIIILSALSRLETVEKAISFGIKSYLTKPLQPDLLIKKAREILKKNF